MSGKVWHLYLMKGGNSTYVGLVSGETEWSRGYPKENFDSVLRRMRRCLTNVRTNLDKDKTPFDEWILGRCRELAEEKYNEDFCIISKGRGGR